MTVATFSGLTDALTLSRRVFPPARWIIPGILPVGLTILAAPEKIGKSWWALQIARAASTQGSVLYLALEDTEESLNWRLGKQPGPSLSTLSLVPQGGGARPLPEGAHQIHGWLSHAPSPFLVIIDTLEKVRGDDADGRQYRSDYKAVSQLKAVADRHNVAILCLHHLNQKEERANEEPGDIMYRVSGTSGLTGAADTVLILRRDRLSQTAKLFATGRRVQTKLEPMEWNEETSTWSLAPAFDAPINPVRDFLHERGPLSRADLVRAYNGSAATAIGHLEDALSLGIVLEVDGLLRATANCPGTPPACRASPPLSPPCP